ncbi:MULTISPECIES: ABC transporter ATP-binding protein [Pelosinus]|jgi:osmoprotectant transport system ATP-binding protein|uniref:Quaternary amine transport ATP-binding protein n=1 Tax=Pelosinus fermentans B4 TaxID=1149862 RepID=I8RMU2_9FIRM|nr:MULTISPECIES: betaine/proline/choline family ABC transporter ATP-binding protein [Pelosinus]EIW20240.1 glycine betaine/L-proline ABC transporter, ATPase subunit [Pelosinus fermentans B4]EIW25922.1 glycine betaine/L-proline ABC transporter, ATPase subunit [Pelosinus fermentans A11]OAM93220.1 putative signal transduction protein with CBS domain containing protein [Pelosinus fermentans DSM 17108]SDQ70710.1 osmoprotectant transport system ATP-binding protein [Pelosinus fermentans]
MIRFENIVKTYENGRTVVDGLNLHIREGEILVLIGPSGCGKTTTMKMINRLVEPTKGKIFIKDEDISKLDPVQLRRNIGYVIQNIGLLPHMTIAENVALVPKLKKWDKDAYIARVNELLRMVNLDPEVYGSRYPNELSGGQQQRIGVIRAMAADPPIILMDEPFSALDPISREQLQDELVRLQEVISKTIIFVTHDIDEAIKIANRICIVKDGNIVQVDTPEKILRHPGNEFVKEFIGVNRLQKAEVLPSIRDIMAKPVTARPSKGLAEAIVQMRKQKVDTLLIVDYKQKLLGKVSVWDIHNNFQKEEILLKDVQNPVIHKINVNQSLAEALQIISKHHIAYLPVVSEENELVGVITRSSLVDVMAERFQEVEGGLVIEEGAIVC